jgi:hypothetical protein
VADTVLPTGLQPPTPPKLPEGLNQNPYGDADVAGQVAKVVSQDGPLMTQARTDGLKMANRRGLLNSSMAIGASQGEVLRTAVPIGSQTAAQINARNMSDQGFHQEGALQTQRIGSAEGMAAREIASREGMQEKGILSEEGMHARGLSSAEGLAAREIASREWMQGLDLESREKLATMDIDSRELLANLDINSRERMLANQLSAAEQTQLRDLTARSQMLGQELDARESLLLQELSSRERLQTAEFQHLADQREQDRALQEQIAQWNVEASERQAAAQLAASQAQSDAYLKAAIMSNTNLDASTREQALHAATQGHDAGLKSAESLFGISVAGW